MKKPVKRSAVDQQARSPELTSVDPALASHKRQAMYTFEKAVYAEALAGNLDPVEALQRVQRVKQENR